VWKNWNFVKRFSHRHSRAHGKSFPSAKSQKKKKARIFSLILPFSTDAALIGEKQSLQAAIDALQQVRFCYGFHDNRKLSFVLPTTTRRRSNTSPTTWSMHAAHWPLQNKTINGVHCTNS
jgi:hypothetical protein